MSTIVHDTKASVTDKEEDWCELNFSFGRLVSNTFRLSTVIDPLN